VKEQHVDVPVGIRAKRWATIPTERTVLLVVHNITTLSRMLDILPVFDSDWRMQLVASWNDTDPFQHGLHAAIEQLGIIPIPWEQAKNTAFDLAIAASNHGQLTDITAPLVIISHGIGYSKYLPRKPETGNRERPETGRPSACHHSGCWMMVSRSRMRWCCRTRSN
jgi:hypothetical protein